MTICPHCNAENIKGTDDCAACGQPLADTGLAPPSNAVERSLLRDHISALGPKSPITVEPTMPVGDVLRLLVEQRIGCVVVADGDWLPGDGYANYIKPFRTIEDIHVFAALAAWWLQVGSAAQWPASLRGEIVHLLVSLRQLAGHGGNQGRFRSRVPEQP